MLDHLFRRRPPNRDKARLTAMQNAKTLFADGYSIHARSGRPTGRYDVWKPRSLKSHPDYTIQLWRTESMNQPFVYECNCPFYDTEKAISGHGWCKHGEGLLERILSAMPLVLSALDAPAQAATSNAVAWGKPDQSQRVGGVVYHPVRWPGTIYDEIGPDPLGPGE